MNKPTIGHYASHQRDVTAQEDAALNAALRSSTIKVEHPEIARLRDELAECKHDAERYRWLKPRVSGRDYRNMGVIYGDGGEGIDEAIDAALAADGNAPATPA